MKKISFMIFAIEIYRTVFSTLPYVIKFKGETSLPVTSIWRNNIFHIFVFPIIHSIQKIAPRFLNKISPLRDRIEQEIHKVKIHRRFSERK